MNQKLTQKEPILEQPCTIQEQATKLLKNRAGMLMDNADQFFLENIQFQQKWDAYQEIIDHFKNYQERPKNLDYMLLLAKRDLGKRFKIDRKDLLNRINEEFQVNFQIMSEKVEVKRIPSQHPLIVAAKNNILRNQQIVRKIIIYENLPQTIEQFFTKTKFYSYSFTQVTIQKSHGLESNPIQQETLSSEIQQSESQVQQEDASGGPNNLQGLSAYNGKQTYINKILLDNAEKELHLLETLLPLGKNNNEYDSLSDIFKALVTLEHEGQHNLIRLLMNNEDPQLISPEKCDELRIKGEMQEAGNYYAFEAYGIEADVSPFCLNIKKLP